ncbi:MAG: hypothetical protein AW11_02002 [Candidatus Accumulibacter regalis]|uniref:Uncharacterized protein n=1 Tax=Accumulibacter regalis TaxID=522306 RepID=A0A011RCF0_ACCRE|nr:MAG: hypothetical protein AW11_02002 [Candidatus Accumulibacter regalis]
MESAATTDLAFDPDAPAEKLGQARRYAQSETGAAVLAGDRPVGLREGVENRRQFFFGNTDATVGHREVQIQLAISVSISAFQAQQHLPAGGEFDRVADQVEQHLAQATGVAEHQSRHRGGDVADQRQFLVVRAQGERLECLANAAPEIEGAVLGDQLAGLDLGEVEDVVDDRQQRVGRVLDDLHAGALFIAELAVEEEMGHADDAVHGRSYLVAHVGQKLGLGAVGGFRAFLGAAQLLGCVLGG